MTIKISRPQTLGPFAPAFWFRRRPVAWLPAAATMAQIGEIAGVAAGLRRILPNKSFTVSPESAQQRIVFRRFLTILQRNEQVVPGRFGRASFLGALRPSKSRF